MICSGVSGQVEECNQNLCPIDGEWSQWSDWSECSRSCDGGVRNRRRSCNAPQRGGKFCQGHSEETARCNSVTCPSDGAWSNWSQWSQCSVSCGRGIKTRIRDCDDPPPVNGGADCTGINIQRTHCHQTCKKSQPIRVEGKFNQSEAF